jgi:hypothetical protein
MKNIQRTIGVAVVCLVLVLTAGCVIDPNGRPQIDWPIVQQIIIDEARKIANESIIAVITPAQQAQLPPQTVKTIQHNDAVVQQPTPSQTTETLTPLTIDDIKALTGAGVKPEVIIAEIMKSNSTYSQTDINAAKQVNNPSIAQAVIEYMKSHAK